MVSESPISACSWCTLTCRSTLVEGRSRPWRLLWTHCGDPQRRCMGDRSGRRGTWSTHSSRRCCRPWMSTRRCQRSSCPRTKSTTSTWKFPIRTKESSWSSSLDPRVGWWRRSRTRCRKAQCRGWYRTSCSSRGLCAFRWNPTITRGCPQHLWPLHVLGRLCTLSWSFWQQTILGVGCWGGFWPSPWIFAGGCQRQMGGNHLATGSWTFCWSSSPRGIFVWTRPNPLVEYGPFYFQSGSPSLVFRTHAFAKMLSISVRSKERPQ